MHHIQYRWIKFFHAKGSGEVNLIIHSFDIGPLTLWRTFLKNIIFQILCLYKNSWLIRCNIISVMDWVETMCNNLYIILASHFPVAFLMNISSLQMAIFAVYTLNKGWLVHILHPFYRRAWRVKYFYRG